MRATQCSQRRARAEAREDEQHDDYADRETFSLRFPQAILSPCLCSRTKRYKFALWRAARRTRLAAPRVTCVRGRKDSSSRLTNAKSRLAPNTWRLFALALRASASGSGSTMRDREDTRRIFELRPRSASFIVMYFGWPHELTFNLFPSLSVLLAAAHI